MPSGVLTVATLALLTGCVFGGVGLAGAATAGDTARKDTTAPVVTVFPASGHQGGTATLKFKVSDDSGQANPELFVFRGTKPCTIGDLACFKARAVVQQQLGYGPATGSLEHVTLPLHDRSLTGPLVWCMNANDVAGHLSALACAPLVVSASTPGPKPTGSQGKDTSPPQVEALAKGLTKPGTRDTLLFTVKDDSDHAKAHITLYQGGKPIQSAIGSDKAHGQKWAWSKVLFANDLDGPLFFCVWAEDAAGNRSARAPHSSCAWIKLLVPIERVSNGCGGGVATWDVGVLAQNYFGNEHTYFDSGSGLKYTVNFKDACDLHDAGYGGHTVVDKLRPGKQGIKDFRDSTRREVDNKFLQDMRLLCHQGIPATAEDALAKCIGGAAYYALPVNHEIGAETLYGFVHKFGDMFFDSDLTKPGLQSASEKTGPRDRFNFG
jgi:hypothetical protein